MSSLIVSDRHDEIDDDVYETATWHRIVQRRVEESEVLGITSILLHDHGDDKDIGNTETCINDDDDIDALIVVRKFLLQQLLLHHINIMTNHNPTVTTSFKTTQRRLRSYNTLQQIFDTIDTAKQRIATITENVNVNVSTTFVEQDESKQLSEIQENIDTTDMAVDREDITLERSESELDAVEVSTANNKQNGNKVSKIVEKNGKIERLITKTNSINKTTSKKSKVSTADTNKVPKKRKRPLGEPIVIGQQPTTTGTSKNKSSSTNLEASGPSVEKPKLHSNIMLSVEDMPIQKKMRPPINDTRQHSLTSMMHTTTEEAVLPLPPKHPKRSPKIPKKKNIVSNQNNNNNKNHSTAQNENHRELTSEKESNEMNSQNDLGQPLRKNMFEKDKVNSGKVHEGKNGSTSFSEMSSKSKSNTRLHQELPRTSTTGNLDNASNQHKSNGKSELQILHDRYQNQERKRTATNFYKPPSTSNNASYNNRKFHQFREGGDERSQSYSTNKSTGHHLTASDAARTERVHENSTHSKQNGFRAESFEHMSHTNSTLNIRNNDIGNNESTGIRNGKKTNESFPLLDASNQTSHGTNFVPNQHSAVTISSTTTDCGTFNSNTDVGDVSTMPDSFDKILRHEVVFPSRKYLSKLPPSPMKHASDIWICRLCDTVGIRTHNLIRHCSNLKHINFLELTVKRTEAENANCSLASNPAPTDTTFQSSFVDASREFLIRRQKDKFSPVTWNCSLCNVTDIKTQYLTAHCQNALHLQRLSSKAAVMNDQDAKPNASKNITKETSNSLFNVEPNATSVWCDIDESDSSIKVSNPISYSVTADSNPTPIASTYTARLMCCTVTVAPKEITMQQVELIGNRLQEWDPFWIIKSIVCIGLTQPVKSVTPKSDMIKTAMQHYLPRNLKSKYKLSTIKDGKWNNGDLVLLLRMLPESYNLTKNKRSDFHLWPKGSFIQINGKPQKVEQRKQQSVPFDKEWKGLCKELCVNKTLSESSEHSCIQISCADDEPYNYTLTYCQYRDPQQLFSILVDPKSKEQMTYLSFEDSLQKAKNFANQQLTSSMDSDNDDENDSADTAKFICTLTCPISRSRMVTPVRGKHCKHFQCYDLRNYIDSNVRVSGTRWRCASCEMFVSIQNLEICGLTSHLLKEFNAAATSERDRIEFKADGTYKLLEQQVLRHKKALDKALQEQEVEIIDLD